MLKANDQFKILDDDLAYETFDLFHRLISSNDACDSWYELSCADQFEECDGEELLSWKSKGYVTVFDLLQVSVFIFQLIKNNLIFFHVIE